MTKRKIVVAQNIKEELQDAIREAIPDWEIIIGKERKNWEKHVKDAEVIAGWKKEMEEIFLQNNSKLRWIQSWSAGINQYPLEVLDTKNIFLTNASGVHAYPISESIFALMLALTRKIHTYVRNQTEKKWDPDGLKLEMHEKTIGIIGLGAIGKETAKIAKAFGMKVIGVRNTNKPEKFVDQMVTANQMNAILPSCDYVVVTLPLTKKTYHLFKQKQFEEMKSSSFFINIGRGEVVDEQALINALQYGQIAGAGLDVFETEPLEQHSPLWGNENVIITPHSAGSNEYYDERVIRKILIPNLINYKDGNEPIINLIDFSKGY